MTCSRSVNNEYVKCVMLYMVIARYRPSLGLETLSLGLEGLEKAGLV